MFAKKIPILSSILLALGPVAAVSANPLEDILEAIVKDSSSHHQEQPHYSTGGGYYPYTPAPEKAPPASRNQHAYDVGYRVGQDDFHHHLTKHFTRHPKLYDRDTHDAFARGYESGYDVAREKASLATRHYEAPKVHSEPVKSSLYPSGYYPYSRAPKAADDATKKRHAYDIGFKIGQDDFHAGHSKHFTRHKELYDDSTHHNFALGYEHGYDKARNHARRDAAPSPPHSSGVKASVGQGKVTIRDGSRVLSTVHTALPNIESHRFINGGRQIVVKSRGNHGPASVELFDVRTGVLRDKVLAFSIKGGKPSWARGMED